MKVKTTTGTDIWNCNDDFILAKLNLTLGWNDNTSILMSPIWQLIHKLEQDN